MHAKSAKPALAVLYESREASDADLQTRMDCSISDRIANLLNASATESAGVSS
jgi:hypothetical protein